jgi:hypothetical protein
VGIAALTGSPGAHRYYDAHRARGATHHQALRALANRLVGILHGCLRHRRPYDEQVAWPTTSADAAARPSGEGMPGEGTSLPRHPAILLARATVVQLGRHARASRFGRRPIAQRRAAPLRRAPAPRWPLLLSHQPRMIPGTTMRRTGRMDREQFWALIEAAKTASGGDCRSQAAQLVAALRQRSVDEVLAWDRIHGELMAESYGWDLWGAAYLINGGCSDDGFDYFRGWLLGQGLAIWRGALADPDSLADHPEIRAHRPDQEWYVYLQCEDILGVPYRAYEALTGQEFTVEVAGMRPWPPPLGQDWDFDDAAEMRRRRYRRLWAICGWDEASSPSP